MNEEFKAGVFVHPAFGRFATIMTALTVSLLFLLSRELALIAAAVFLIAFVRLRYRRMVFSTDCFRYDGWLGSVRIPIEDVVDLKPASSFGYPVDRWHGGQLCILTERKKILDSSDLVWSPSSARARRSSRPEGALQQKDGRSSRHRQLRGCAPSCLTSNVGC